MRGGVDGAGDDRRRASARRWIAPLALLLGWIALGAPARAEQVTIFAAASTSAAVEAVIALFDAGEGNRVVGSYAGTSALARQIENGAPAHLFLSANALWMDHLAERGAIDGARRHTLLRNRLVFIAPARSGLTITPSGGLDLGALLGKGRLAIGDPDHVPAGIYAKQALTALGQWPAAADRLAPTADVRGAVALVARGEVPLGIVYATDLGLSADIRLVAPISTDLHAPIVYPLAPITGAATPLSDRFLAFLLGAEARAVFERFGFIVE